MPAGTTYCAGVPNSTGSGGEMEADGSRFTLDLDMVNSWQPVASGNISKYVPNLIYGSLQNYSLFNAFH